MNWLLDKDMLESDSAEMKYWYMDELSKILFSIDTSAQASLTLHLINALLELFQSQKHLLIILYTLYTSITNTETYLIASIQPDIIPFKNHLLNLQIPITLLRRMHITDFQIIQLIKINWKIRMSYSKIWNSFEGNEGICMEFWRNIGIFVKEI